VITAGHAASNISVKITGIHHTTIHHHNPEDHDTIFITMKTSSILSGHLLA
jgi:hypothetical protein